MTKLFNIIKETETYTVSTWGDTGTRESKAQKFLCIGGPLHDQYWSQPQLYNHRNTVDPTCVYVRYNRSDSVRGNKSNCIYIWERFLED